MTCLKPTALTGKIGLYLTDEPNSANAADNYS